MFYFPFYASHIVDFWGCQSAKSQHSDPFTFISNLKVVIGLSFGFGLNIHSVWPTSVTPQVVPPCRFVVTAVAL